MSNLDVIRAWKDEEYRASLRDFQLAVLPAHPAGAVELPPDDLDSAGANENPVSYPGMCTCLGICPFTNDMLCGSTMEFFACTLVMCPPWIL
jgi:mersacidin/lichenicidin family type 2 lantibiotic